MKARARLIAVATLGFLFSAPFCWPQPTGGRVAAWGENSSDQTNVPAGLTDSAMAADPRKCDLGPAGEQLGAAAGEIAPNFTLTNHLTSQPVSLYDLTGSVVLLEFFWTECPHCQAAMPQIKTNIHDYYLARGGNAHEQPVTVFYVSVSSASDRVDAFIRDYGLDLVADDTPEYTVFHQFGGQSVPHFVVINGVTNSASHQPWEILNRVVGFDASTVQTLRTEIDLVNGPPDPPVILIQPQSQAVVIGDDVTFSVVARGAAPLTYQWWKDGQALVGQTETSLTLTNVQPWDRDVYSVIVSNAYGQVTSTNAVVSLVNVVVWGSQTEVPAEATDVIQAAAGAYHTLLLKSDGGMSAWGGNAHGQATVPPNLTNVVGIAAGHSHNVVLRADRSVFCWGYNDYGQINVPASVTNAVAVAAGLMHSLAVLGDGRVVAWGENSGGQINVPGGLNNVVTVSGGDRHSLALRADGTVVGWGQTTVPGNLGNVVAVAAGATESLALREDGSVVAWGGQNQVPPEATNVVAIAAGWGRFMAVRGDGRVVTWSGGSASLEPVTDALAGAVGYQHNVAVLGYSPPQFVAQPVSQSVYVGEMVELQVTVRGTRPLHYQWRKNAADLEGQTNSVLSFPDAQLSDSGAYALVVTNIFGAVTSQVATVTVQLMMPGILQPPTDLTVLAGEPASFSVVVTGTPPVHVQWRKDGAELDGQTEPSLSFASVQVADAGAYNVVVTNLAGSVTSAVARLTVQCSLTLNISGDGTVSSDPAQTILAGGAVVTLTAQANPNHQLAYWSGDASGDQNPLTLTMDTNKSVTAHFLPTFTVAASTNGHGAVAVSPVRARYMEGTTVQLTATPARWHVFTSWNDGATDNPRTVIVTSDATFVANFLPTQALETVDIGGVPRLAPVGMPSVLVDGVFVTADSVSARGTAEITLLSTFTNAVLLYTLDSSDPSTAGLFYSGPFSLKQTRTVRAVAYPADLSRAVPSDPLTVIILPTITTETEGGGTVAVEPPEGAYFSNALAVVTASPEPGWSFLHWLGDADGTSPFVNVRMTQNRRLKAVFGTTLTTNIVGSGAVQLNPASAFYPYGTEVRLTAVPAAGSYLAQWSGSVGGISNPLVYTVTNPNPVIGAVFASFGGAPACALTVLSDGLGHVTLTPQTNRYPRGTNVTLQAAPEPGQKFTGWSGDAVGTNNPITVTMTASKVITAGFSKRPTLIVHTPLEGLSDLGFRLTLQGEWGIAYRIDGCTHPPLWTPLGWITNTFGTVQFTDTPAGPNSHRLYRAVLP